MINIAYNIDQVVAELSAFQRKQVPFALQLSINRTLESRQLLLQDHVDDNLTIRGNARSKFRGAIRFAREDRADKKADKLTGQLRILGVDTSATAPVYQQIGALILRQDQGGTRTSDQLYRGPHDQELILGGFAIPAPGLRTAAKGVPRKLYPVNLGLTTRTAIAGGNEFSSNYKGGRTKSGKRFKKNTKFYFVKKDVGIFVRQQIGAESEYDAVWFFRRQINLPNRLHLAETFERGLDDELAVNFNGFLQFAIRTAK